MNDPTWVRHVRLGGISAQDGGAPLANSQNRACDNPQPPAAHCVRATERSPDRLSARLFMALSGAPLMSNRVADLYSRQVDLIEHDLVGLAKTMPAEHYNFRPSEGSFTGVRTFGDQVKHAATMIFMTAAIVLEERSPHGPGTADNGPDAVQGKEQIVDYLERSFAYARKAMASLTEDNHLDPLRTYFGGQPRIEVANGVIYHSYDHYGQMVVYARMNGVVPPASRR